MVTLELCNHVWRYSRLACLHLSQLALFPPANCKVIATIVHAPRADDPKVADVIDFFCSIKVPNVQWNFCELKPPYLCRRAIGRNVVALESKADFVCFGDIDYMFGEGSLDALAAAMVQTCSVDWALMFPRRVMCSRDQGLGDSEIEKVISPAVIELDRSKFKSTKLPRAIGGAQYVPGDFARKRGYLPTSRRFQKPADHWRRTYEDRLFRMTSRLRSVGLSIPNVFRIRHSKRGRFDIGVEL